MKQFLLFCGPNYYPAGGWRDFQGSYDSFQDAVLHIANNAGIDHDWWHVVDSTTGEIIK